MSAKHNTPCDNPKTQTSGDRNTDARVLYIHPAKQGAEFRVDQNIGRAYGLIPVGLPALINLLKQNGVIVRGINYSLERQINPTFEFRDWLKQFPAARIILIDLHWYEHCYGAIQTARLCKEILPQAYTVLGGLSASGFSSQILEQIPEVDFIIRGDAEQPLLALVQRILQTGQSPHFTDIPNLSYRQGEAIVENDCTYCATTSDLDALDFADIDFMDHSSDYYVHE
jgi:radical SAM superfamily enzyme YgiQ (UPF0313 family)